MTYPDELLRLIDERADARIAAFAGGAAALTGATSGTINYRTGSTTCMVTLDGSALAVPVKVFGDVEVMEGDRVGLVRIGSEWTVVGTFTRRRSITMPDETKTGEQRMQWGADTPPELQSYGLTVAMIAFTLDSVTGLEVGYFFIAVSNIMDSPDSRSLVFGNVSYPTPGNPASATVSEVKTNFQMDMFAQFPNTIFKDHTVAFWTNAQFGLVNNSRLEVKAKLVTASQALVPGNFATNTGYTSGAYTNVVGIPTVTFVKGYDDTALDLQVHGAGYANVANVLTVGLAILINGVDYTCGVLAFNPANTHFPISGIGRVAGGVLPAGSYSGTALRVALLIGSGGGNTFTMDTNDLCSFRVREVPA